MTLRMIIKGLICFGIAAMIAAVFWQIVFQADTFDTQDWIGIGGFTAILTFVIYRIIKGVISKNSKGDWDDQIR